MADPELFSLEKAVLARAETVAGDTTLGAAQYRRALEELIRHYRRLMWQTHRLIRHGDRTEAELSDANSRLQALSVKLDYKARHDTLTGTLNRGALFDMARRYLLVSPLAMIALDIDHFKRVNDTYGHPTGDHILSELAQRLIKTLAHSGKIGRVGGEEFVILLPDTALITATNVAHSLRLAIGEHIFPCLPVRAITASLGVSWSPAGTHIEHAYAQADAALYRAKQAGRNHVAW